MSSNAPAHQDAHHDHGHGHTAGHGSFRDYMTGFVLSVILTAIPFWLVMSGVIENRIVTAALVESVFGLPCTVIDDPVSHTPLVIPQSGGLHPFEETAS